MNSFPPWGSKRRLVSEQRQGWRRGEERSGLGPSSGPVSHGRTCMRACMHACMQIHACMHHAAQRKVETRFSSHVPAGKTTGRRHEARAARQGEQKRLEEEGEGAADTALGRRSLDAAGTPAGWPPPTCSTRRPWASVQGEQGLQRPCVVGSSVRAEPVQIHLARVHLALSRSDCGD